eukprot:365976-Chlamydomonas_euryale.AAC.11
MAAVAAANGPWRQPTLPGLQPPSHACKSADHLGEKQCRLAIASGIAHRHLKSRGRPHNANCPSQGGVPGRPAGLSCITVLHFKASHTRFKRHMKSSYTSLPSALPST